MSKWNLNDAKRLEELVQNMCEELEEAKQLCRSAMSHREYDLFKYRTLGHLEPGLTEEHEWVTRYSSIDSLQKIAENAVEETEGGNKCKKCGSSLDESEFCTDETCPYSEIEQYEEPDTEPKQES